MAEVDPRRDLLAQLGLDPGADDRRIDEAHAALVAYLNAAPRAARPWARRQLADIEAAYQALERRQARNGHTPVGAAAHAAPKGYVASDADDAEELLDALDDRRHPAPAVSIPHQVRRQKVTTVVRREPERGTGRTVVLRRGSRRLGLTLGGLAIAVIAVVGIYKLGEPSVPGLTGSPAPGATSAMNEARVAQLMEQINTNPRDVAALRELADLYYAAGDNRTSRTWLLKVLEIEPNNVEALLGAGATAYNLDDFTAAEEAWRKVLTIDPRNIDAHYDLGLMYFSMDPPNLDAMRAAWNKVIELAPDSQLASIVRTHMPQPSSSGLPSGAPASPAASGAPASPAAPGTSGPAATAAPAPSAAPGATTAPAAS